MEIRERLVNAVRRYGAYGLVRVAAAKVIDRVKAGVNDRRSTAHVRRLLADGRVSVPVPRLILKELMPAGFGARDLETTEIDGDTVLFSADVGDDTVSVNRICNGVGKSIGRIDFPRSSAPIGVVTVPVGDERRIVCALFNFDETGRQFQRSALLMSNISVRDLLARLEVNNGHLSWKENFTTLIERPGFWGFRAIDVVEIAEELVLAVTDRDEDRIVLFSIDASGRMGARLDVNLGTGTEGKREPIGISVVAANEDVIRLVTGFRGEPALCVVDVERRLQEVLRTQTVPLPGQSRSSIAVGRFAQDEPLMVAVGLWGGDPKDLNTPHQGDVVVYAVHESGETVQYQRIEAGIHPTDVAAADLDGDGLDELVVLNYGAGLTRASPRVYGGLQVFKLQESTQRFTLWQQLDVPNPRIATTLPRGDGEGEDLLVTLFFENKVARIGAK